jgi:uncharacterized protein with von Willebrand factor type A (vWA) domain
MTSFTNRELRQNIYLDPVIDKSCPKTFIMLIDVSGSMSGTLESSTKGKITRMYTRADYAIASAICLLRASLKGGHNCRLFAFDSSPTELLQATPEAVERYLYEMPFSGGGTYIGGCLKKLDELEAEEIILISDGEDQAIAEFKYEMKTPVRFYHTGNFDLNDPAFENYKKHGLYRQLRSYQYIN